MNYKKYFSELGNYIVLGILFLGTIILYVGLTSNSSSNIYFIIIGSLILSPLIIYLIYDKVKSTKFEKRKQKEFQEFKKRADRIAVNLEAIKIKSNSWQETEVTETSYYAGLNELAGRGNRNIKNISKNFNFIEIKIPYRGRVIDYNVNIPMETTKLKLYFAIKKNTTLYIDPMDEERMYLDLEFIK